MRFLFFFLCLLAMMRLAGQRQYYNWCFSPNAGLNFNTVPPQTFSTAASGPRGSSISDKSGNLLFYCSGNTVYNKLHQVMANGGGLFGTAINAAIIVKKPAATDLYYVITQSTEGGGSTSNNAKGLHYSLIDMSLAAGMGSVVTKNVQLYLTPDVATSQELTAVLHCNRTDVWIISRESNQHPEKINAFLLTSSGISTIPVVSQLNGPKFPVGGDLNIVVSPNGKLLAVAYSDDMMYSKKAAVAKFDNQTGLVDTAFVHLIGDPYYGIGFLEFSPDGTKLYGSTQGASEILYQWDLCAGSQAAINASRQEFTITPTHSVSPEFYCIEISPEGKIHVGAAGQYATTVINYPNLAGPSCSITALGQLLAPGPPILNGNDSRGLPIIPNDDFRNFGAVFTYTAHCRQVSFSAPQHMQTSCAFTQPTPVSLEWNFGEPPSGPANTSTVLNASHTYSTTGTFTVQLIARYQCFNDTFRTAVQVLNSGPAVNVSGNFSICPGQTAVLTASGNYNFSWTGNQTGPTVSLSPQQTTQYYLTATDSMNCTASKWVSVTVQDCTGIDENGDLSGPTVFPNPVRDNLTLRCEVPARITLSDLYGRKVIERECREGDNIIDLHNLDEGLYLIQIDLPQRTSTKKILRRH